MASKRLKEAIACLADSHRVSVEWLPYQFNPDCPVEGRPWEGYEQFITGPRWQHLVSEGARAGLVFRGKGDGRTANSSLFHACMAFYGSLDATTSPRGSKQDRFQAAAFEGFYMHGDGFHANETQSYVNAAKRAGLESEELLGFLSDKARVADTQALAVAHAAQLRPQVSGTPFFVVNGEWHAAFSGAQMTPTFVEALQHC